VAQAIAFAGGVAGSGEREPQARQAASALYHAASAVLLAWEGAQLGARGGDARRLLLSRMVLEHRLSPHDPLAPRFAEWESRAADLLLEDAPVSFETAARLVMS
jgi:hypothetical protein